MKNNKPILDKKMSVLYALKVLFFLCVSSNSLFAQQSLETKNKSDLDQKIEFYENNVQSIFDNRCVACHSCFNAPCQLKLTSYEGVKRGGTKNDIFDFNDIKAKSPTRLYIDAHSENAWREKSFFPVVGDNSAFLLSKMINGMEGPESKKQKKY